MLKWLCRFMVWFVVWSLSIGYWMTFGLQAMASELNARKGAGGLAFVYGYGFGAGAACLAASLATAYMLDGLWQLIGRWRSRRRDRPRSVTRGLK